MKNSTRNRWAGALTGFLLVALPGVWLAWQVKDALNAMQSLDLKAALIEPPYVVANFNDSARELSGGGAMIPNDTLKAVGGSGQVTTALGPKAEGFDGSYFLRWGLKMQASEDKSKGMPWAWQTLSLQNGADLSRCQGIRFRVRASRPGIRYTVSLRSYGNPCLQKDDVVEVRGNEAPQTWTLVSLPLKNFRRNESKCPVEFKHVLHINFLVNGNLDANLELDQIEFY